MSDEIIHTEMTPSYHRRPGESVAEYEMFVEWCNIPPSSRRINNYCRRTGFNQHIVYKAHSKWLWDDRARAFDNDSLMLRPNPSNMDDEAALAAQMAAANTLLELGLKSLELKNPSLISSDKALKLVEKGVEIQRRALGQADLNVQFTADDMSRVNKLVEELIIDAEVVDDSTNTDAAGDNVIDSSDVTVDDIPI